MTIPETLRAESKQTKTKSASTKAKPTNPYSKGPPSIAQTNRARLPAIPVQPQPQTIAHTDITCQFVDDVTSQQEMDEVLYVNEVGDDVPQDTDSCYELPQAAEEPQTEVDQPELHQSRVYEDPVDDSGNVYYNS